MAVLTSVNSETTIQLQLPVALDSRALVCSMPCAETQGAERHHETSPAAATTHPIAADTTTVRNQMGQETTGQS